jgi:hypothetical protein
LVSGLVVEDVVTEVFLVDDEVDLSVVVEVATEALIVDVEVDLCVVVEVVEVVVVSSLPFGRKKSAIPLKKPLFFVVVSGAGVVTPVTSRCLLEFDLASATKPGTVEHK